MKRRHLGITTLLVVGFALGPAPEGQADEDAARLQQIASRGIGFLRSRGQAADGSFSGAIGPAVTALATTALLQHGVNPQDGTVARALRYLEKFVQPDGGIYQSGTYYKNYETSLALICFQAANKGGRYKKLVADAERFLKDLQWDQGEGKDKSDFAFGGQGYGKNKRADLSNTSFFVEALVAAGNKSNSDAIQRALVFIARCQNHESAANTTPFAAKNPDGGFYYTPDSGGYSQAGKTPEGGLRSYGSMTYAGLKSMIYAGVGPADPRVKAAVEWLRRHYDLKTNPGMGTSGLFYYYHTFAKALDALGQEVFVDESGNRHHWRKELVAELARRQLQDGSWLNSNQRWYEADANLVTAYALLALHYCRPASK